MDRDTSPERLTSGEFLGRGDALETLNAWLDARLPAAVVGPPGVGKSRLVRQLVATRTGLEAAWIDLNEVNDADGVWTTTAAALSLSPPATLDRETWAAAVARALAGGAFDLLVFDGADGVAAAVSDLLRRLRAACPGVAFVVTSQVELSLSGLRVLHLAPLGLESAGGALSEAAALLVARARAAQPGLQLGPDDGPALEALARALDGLPLALELAASRLPMLGPSQMLDRLVDRFRLLGRGGPSGLTLDEVLNAAYQLLDPVAQDTLRQIAVFRGGFDLDAAERVVDLSTHPGRPWVLDALATLRAHSLLVVEHHPARPGDTARRSSSRYSLLASVRAFAASRSSEDASRAVQSRAALAFAERWRAHTPDPLVPTAEGAALLAAERDNLWAAAWTATTHDVPEWALTTLVLAVTGPSPFIRYASSLPLLDAATRRAKVLDPTSLGVGRLVVKQANLLRFLGRIADSEALLQSLVADATEATETAFGIACAFGNAAAARIAPAEARAHFERALRLASSPGERADVLSMMAATHFAEDQLDLAAACLEEAVRLATAPLPAAIALGSLGIVDFTRGRTTEGVVALSAAHEELVRLGSRHWAAVVLTYLGRADHERGELDLAARRLELARSDAELIGVGRAEAQARLSLGALHLELGALESADAELSRALVLIRATCPDHESLALELRAAVASRASAAQGASPAPNALGEENLRLRADAALARYPRPQFAASLAVLRGAAPVTPEAERWFDVRLARRLRGQLAAGGAAPTPPLVIARDGAWFRLPGEPEVSLRRRQPLRRLLARLSDARTTHPGRVIPAFELVRAGWPGERVLPEAGIERVYTAIATLRRLGLRQALERRDDGYLLSADLPVVWG